MKEDNLNKKIEYWSKHQELDKFNYSVNIDSINNQTIFFGTFFISIIVAGVSLILDGKLFYGSLLVLLSSVLFPTVLNYSTKENKKERDNAKKSFRIREAMLRVFYQEQGVDTDKLDEQFEEIKKRVKEINENKQLELIAKEVIKGKKKK